MWSNLIFKATTHRIEGDNSKYITAVDAITRTLLKKDRETVKKAKSALGRGLGYGLDNKLELYDGILESIVDTLEDSGYLSKEFILETFNSEVTPIGDDEGIE
jgi:hypothetical protein